jgi:hypothetical protein
MQNSHTPDGKPRSQVSQDSCSLGASRQGFEMIREEMWQDMLAITKVLVAYGCLSSEYSLEVDEFVLDSRNPRRGRNALGSVAIAAAE